MEICEQKLKANKNVNYKLVADKDQESGRDICFVIIDDVLVNIFAIAEDYDTISIPDGVRVIKRDAVYDMADEWDNQGLGCVTLSIPASVEIIEGNAFSYMGIDFISLDPDNKNYTLKNGCLFSKNEKTLILVSQSGRRDEDCAFVIPDGTAALADGALRGQYYERLFMPDSVVEFGDLAENENINSDMMACVVYASADSPAANYCKEKGVPYEERK